MAKRIKTTKKQTSSKGLTNVLIALLVVMVFVVAGLCMVSIRAIQQQEAQVPDTSVVQSIHSNKDLQQTSSQLDKVNLDSLDASNL